MADILLADLLAEALRRGEGASLQSQLYAGVQNAILTGVLKPGVRMPSSRALAEALGVARITVVSTYQRLQTNGYLQAGSSSGTYVAELGGARSLLSHRAGSAPHRQVLSRRGQELLRAPAGIQERSGAFVPGVCDADEFPYQTWRRILNRNFGMQDGGLTGYANQGGYLPLRRVLAEYLRVARGVRCTPDQIIVTMGTNQSIDLCSRLLADIGDVAYIETPCHWGMPIVLRANGFEVRPIEIDDKGLQVDQLRTPARFVLTTPTHQFPMGITMSEERRSALLRFAEGADAYVLEDDYDGEFRYGQKPPRALQGSDESGRVIFLGTFSKIMYPGMRLSYLVAPPDLSQAFADAALRLYRPGHLPMQAAMAEFIADGYLARHILRVRDIYADRRAVLQRHLDAHLGDTWSTSQDAAGLHMTIRIDRLRDVTRVTERARNEGIFLRPLSIFNQLGEPFADGFVLGFGAVKVEDIPAATKKFAQIVSEHRGL